MPAKNFEVSHALSSSQLCSVSLTTVDWFDDGIVRASISLSLALPNELYTATWVLALYYPVVLFTLVSLACVSCRDPGLMERVTDEEAGEGGWFWNEQVGSYRPPGALYCRECGVLIQDYDHLYVSNAYRDVCASCARVATPYSKGIQLRVNIALAGVPGPELELAGTICSRSKCLSSRSMFFATLRSALSLRHCCRELRADTFDRIPAASVIRVLNGLCFVSKPARSAYRFVLKGLLLLVLRIVN
jgi:hypothetical protein